MTLGERICALRTERQLSQSDLAEALEVSRQSVSKWETDASIPDLDRLVSMSRIFGVTLDALVLGETPQDENESSAEAAPPTGDPPTGEAPPAEETVFPREPEKVGKTPNLPPRHSQTAVILFCTAGVVAVLGLLLAGLWGLVLAVPFLLCGLMVLVSRRHPGLWCLWGVVLLVQLYLQVGTGINWSIIFLTAQYQPEWNYTRLLIGWGMALADLGLMVGTAWALRREAWAHRVSQRGVILTAVALLGVDQVFIRLVMSGLLMALQEQRAYLLSQLLYQGRELLSLVLWTVLAVALGRWLYRRKRI